MSRRRKLLVAAVAVLGALGLFCVWVSTANVGGVRRDGDELVIINAVVVDADDPVGRPLDIVIRGDRIVTLVPPGSGEAADAGQVFDAGGGFVSPGLIDVHTHMLRAGLCGGDEGVGWANVQQIPMNFDVALAAGNTTVVDLAGPLHGVIAIRDALDGEDSQAPRYLVAGPLITGADGYPMDWADPELVRDLEAVVILSDEDDARREVARLSEAGVDLIKIAWMDVAYNDQPLPTMPIPVFAAAVDEAHRQGLRVFVHAHTNAGYDAALQAGADVIAHSSFEALTDELIERVVESETVIVPTLWTFLAFERAREDPAYLEILRPQLLPALFEKLEAYDRRMRSSNESLPDDFLPDIHWSRIREANTHARENLRRLAAAGARIAYGTDTSFCYALHGGAADELQAMADNGLAPQQVFTAATRGSADAIGREDLGRIAPDAAADLLVLEANPFSDLSTLRSPVAVISRGQVVIPQDTPGVRRTLRVALTLITALYGPA